MINTRSLPLIHLHTPTEPKIIQTYTFERHYTSDFFKTVSSVLLLATLCFEAAGHPTPYHATTSHTHWLRG